MQPRCSSIIKKWWFWISSSFFGHLGISHVENWMVTKREAHRVFLSNYFINKMVFVCIAPLSSLACTIFSNIFSFFSFIGLFSHFLLWTPHSWALPTSQWCEWSFSNLFFRFHLFKHLKFVKICPFFNNILYGSQYNVTNFESLIKDDVNVHFHTWANMFDLFFPPHAFKWDHHHP